MKEKHKAKLCRAKQKCDNETKWRDEKIQNLERELSLCSHSVAKVNLQFVLPSTNKTRMFEVGQLDPTNMLMVLFNLLSMLF